MLSKGIQIALGIFTVIAFPVAATIALGETYIIDTYEFAEEKPILLCAVYVLYFAVFVIYAALAKKKNLETLAKTTIISGAIPAAIYLFSVIFENVIELLVVIVVVVFYPAMLMASPFVNSFYSYAKILGTVVLFAAPIVSGIIYKFSKRPENAVKSDAQDPAKEA